MKKLLLAIFSLISFISYSQTTGHLRYDTVRIYKMGGNAEVVIESATRDTIGFLYNYGNGRTRFEAVRAVPGGIKFGNDTIFVSGTTEDKVLDGGDVVYSGTGYTFNITPAIFRLDNVIYTADSGSFTLSPSDPSLNRIDKVYFDTIGQRFHILEGTPGIPAAEPQVAPGQVPWVIISVPAGSTAPVTNILWDENTESVVSTVGAGITIDANNTTNVFRLLKSVNVTSTNANDAVIFTPTLPIDISQASSINIHIKLKANLAIGNNLFAQFYVGATPVSGSVALGINKTNTTTYQPISIPIGAFGMLTNYNITALRLTYVGSSTVYSGFYLDYIFFQNGVTTPGPGGGVSSVTLNVPPSMNVTGNNTGDVNLTLSGIGTRAGIIRADLTAEQDSTVKYIGTINSQTKSANGAVINTATNQIVLQESDAANNGLTTALRHRQIDTLIAQTIENGDNTLDTLVYPIDLFRTAVKSLKDSLDFHIIDHGTHLTMYVDATGGTAQRFGFAGEDDAAAEPRQFDLNSNTFQIFTNDGTTFNFIDFVDDQNFNVGSQGLFGNGYFVFSSGGIYVQDLDASAGAANKMVVYDTITGRLGTQAISGGGGSDGNGIYDGSGSLTGNTAVALAGNTFSINQGANSFLSIDPTADAEEIRLQAVNTTGGGNSSFFESATSDVSAEFSFGASFNAGASQVSIGGVSASGVSALVLTADDITLTGAVKIVDGTESNGYVFTSDASGNGSWQPAPGGTPALTQYRLAIGDASSLLSTGAAITGNRALISDANGVPTHSITTATELTYVNGVTSAIQTQLNNKTFTIPIQSLSSTTINDAATHYLGNFPAVWNTSATVYEMTVDKACTLIGAMVEFQCTTAGSNEDWTLYVRVNNTTDYTISTLGVSASRRSWTNTAINTTGVALVAGDKIVVKSINPTWGTNPGSCINSGYLRFREN